jgi:hypothetical protein
VNQFDRQGESLPVSSYATVEGTEFWSKARKGTARTQMPFANFTQPVEQIKFRIIGQAGDSPTQETE